MSCPPCPKQASVPRWNSRNERMNQKIRTAQLQKVPYMLVVGDREAEAGAVAVRSRDGGDLGAMPLAEFVGLLAGESQARVSC